MHNMDNDIDHILVPEEELKENMYIPLPKRM